MLKCFFIKRRLIDYLDGVLPAEAASGVRRHLEACASCRASFDGVKDMAALARQTKSPVMDEEAWRAFDRRLSRGLDEIAKTSPAGSKRIFSAFFLPRWRPVLVAVPLAVIVLAIGLRLVTPVLYERQTSAAIVADVDLLDEVATKDNGRGEPWEDDVSAEIEMLYQLDPALLEGIR